jgi:hypothetical protein
MKNAGIKPGELVSIDDEGIILFSPETKKLVRTKEGTLKMKSVFLVVADRPNRTLQGNVVVRSGLRDLLVTDGTAYEWVEACNMRRLRS